MSWRSTVKKKVRSFYPVCYSKDAATAFELFTKLGVTKADQALFNALPTNHVPRLFQYCEKSKSQLRQDLFVLSELNFKRDGYFIEFGATDGEELSNTHILEKHFGWTGILAEPAIIWHEELIANRNCIIEKDCVWKDTGSVLNFNESDSATLSTIDEFSADDKHAKSREHGKRYPVRTISLNDLLEKHNAPTLIDYLSIDTEGSEFAILNAFDFSRGRFRIISCEHNRTANREKIFDLLTSVGYERKFEQYSDFDDWYVLRNQ